ncbi:HK97-gp10 family putative phage morphogenesis protein, partial [Lysobacter sp. D1-1-M9]|uniref:HK97-gp10 family putative phage morphogenesis protein n=1 Tax=Novilysobacter longmucuonensis TaxID=3098603 RepID=UPI002FC796AD
RYADTSRNRGRGRAGQKYRTAGAVWYGRMVELGTSKMPARPFLRPALANKGMEAVNVFRAILLKRVEAAERKLSRMK